MNSSPPSRAISVSRSLLPSEDAMDEYLQKKNLQIEKPGEDNLLTKAKQVLQEYIEALKTATEAHKRYAETRSKLANDETHHDESVQSSVTVQHPQKPHSAKAMLAYLFYHQSFYHIRAFISSQYVRWTLRAILFSVWLMCSRTRKWRTGNGEEPHRYAY